MTYIRRIKNTSNMKKNAYVTPGFKEVSLDMEDLLVLTASAVLDGIKSDEIADMIDGDNRSRNQVWDDEDEEW